VARLQVIYRTASFDAYLELLTKQNREQMVRLKAAIEADAKASEAFREAINSQFGEDSFSFPLPKLNFRQVVYDPSLVAEVIGKTAVNDSDIELKLRVSRLLGESGTLQTVEVTQRAIWEDGGWKLADGEPLAEGALRCKYFEEHARVSQEVATAVKAGKFRDHREAMKAWREAQDAWMKRSKP
jgi:hypothetical protein